MKVRKSFLRQTVMVRGCTINLGAQRLPPPRLLRESIIETDNDGYHYSTRSWP
jgi:hypothetical protein